MSQHKERIAHPIAKLSYKTTCWLIRGPVIVYLKGMGFSLFGILDSQTEAVELVRSFLSTFWKSKTTYDIYKYLLLSLQTSPPFSKTNEFSWRQGRMDFEFP